MAARSWTARRSRRRIRAEVAKEVEELGTLGLATVLVGDDPASDVYIPLKHKAAAEVGIEPVDKRLPADTTEEEVLALVEELNADEAVDGLLVQTPAAGAPRRGRILSSVVPAKDVDGFHPINAGLLYLGRNGHVPATPLGVMRAPRGVPRADSPARARSSSVAARSSASRWRSCSSRRTRRSRSATRARDDLARHTLDADMLVAAVGSAGLITAEMVKAGATVIDVGMNRTEAGLVGDVDPGAAEVAAFLTPVPGGVGPMTIGPCSWQHGARRQVPPWPLAFP